MVGYTAKKQNNLDHLPLQSRINRWDIVYDINRVFKWANCYQWETSADIGEVCHSRMPFNQSMMANTVLRS